MRERLLQRNAGLVVACSVPQCLQSSGELGLAFPGQCAQLRDDLPQKVF